MQMERRATVLCLSCFKRRDGGALAQWPSTPPFHAQHVQTPPLAPREVLWFHLLLCVKPFLCSLADAWTQSREWDRTPKRR